MFKVIVPYRENGRWKYCSYPPSGHPLYTRERAIEIMKRFYSLCPWEEATEREVWAESERERFTLHFPEVLVDPFTLTELRPNYGATQLTCGATCAVCHKKLIRGEDSNYKVTITKTPTMPAPSFVYSHSNC